MCNNELILFVVCAILGFTLAWVADVTLGPSIPPPPINPAPLVQNAPKSLPPAKPLEKTQAGVNKTPGCVGAATSPIGAFNALSGDFFGLVDSLRILQH